MDILLSLIVSVVVSILSAFHYAALTGASLASMKSKQYAYAVFFGMLFGIPAYFFLLKDGIGGALFMAFAFSFLGSSIGLELSRLIESAFLSNK